MQLISDSECAGNSRRSIEYSVGRSKKQTWISRALMSSQSYTETTHEVDVSKIKRSKKKSSRLHSMKSRPESRLILRAGASRLEASNPIILAEFHFMSSPRSYVWYYYPKFTIKIRLRERFERPRPLCSTPTALPFASPVRVELCLLQNCSTYCEQHIAK